jgi:hypothetical protein
MTTQGEGQAALDRKLWRAWVLANSAAIAAGLGLTALSYSWIASETAAIALGLGALGMVLGVAQWAVVRARLPRAGWWVAATGGSAVAAVLLGLATGQVAAGVGMGIVGMGVGQWLVLRGQVPRATRWLVGSLLGWILSGLLLPLVSVVSLLIGMEVLFARGGDATPLGSWLAAHPILTGLIQLAGLLILFLPYAVVTGRVLAGMLAREPGGGDSA